MNKHFIGDVRFDVSGHNDPVRQIRCHRISLLVFIAVSLLTSNSALSQEEKPRNVEYILRAKALGFVIIEDLWVRSFSIGGELRFRERFSLTADLVHFRWKFEEEVHYDTTNYSNYDEYALYDARNYVAFELRYYPVKAIKDNYRPYLNIFSKIGRRHLHIQENYPSKHDQVIRLNSDFYDLGSAIGLSIGKTFGFDFNMGAVYRWETKSEDIFQKNADPLYTSNVAHNRWDFNIRVSFFYNFSI